MLALQTPNLVDDIKDLIEHFDTSNYPGNLKKTVLLAHWLIFLFFFFSGSSSVQQRQG